MYKNAHSPQPHQAGPHTDCLPLGAEEAEKLTSGISRVRLIFSFPTIPLPAFSADIIVETDTFSQQVPEKHHFQVEKLVLDCMGWIQY